MKHCLALLILGSLVACDRSATSGSPFGDTPPSPLLQPFQGPWKFDLDKSLALWQAQGVPAATLAQARGQAKVVPLHEDMKIKGNVAVLGGTLEGEYFFYALHSHDQRVCGKAWHHEDRHDPGDMSKCYVRLELKNAELHLSQRLEEDSANPDDPDVANPPPTGSAESCNADAAPEPAWSPWMTYVFVKGQP